MILKIGPLTNLRCFVFVFDGTLIEHLYSDKGLFPASYTPVSLSLITSTMKMCCDDPGCTEMQSKMCNLPKHIHLRRQGFTKCNHTRQRK